MSSKKERAIYLHLARQVLHLRLDGYISSTKYVWREIDRLLRKAKATRKDL